MDNSQSEFKERLEAMIGRGRGNPLNFPNPAFANTRPLLPQPPPPPNMTTTTSHNSDMLHQELSMPILTPMTSSSGSGSNDSFGSTSQVQGHVQIRKPQEQLSLSLMTLSLSAPTLSNFENGTSHRNENSCKSPRRMTPGRSRIWSPVICTVCMEDLFTYSDPADVTPYSNPFDLLGENHGGKTLDDIRPTVSTRCGHLFHTECINKWFIEKKESEIKECPFCKREMMANDTTRVFPIFGDD